MAKTKVSLQAKALQEQAALNVMVRMRSKQLEVLIPWEHVAQFYTMGIDWFE